MSNPPDHLVVIEDITEAKASKQILIEAQARVEDIINSIEGIVWEAVVDDDYTCTFISKKVEDILGYNVQEWMNTKKFHSSKLHPDDFDWFSTYLTNELFAKTHHIAEYRMIAKDGTTVWFRDMLTISLTEGRPKKLRGIMIDITEQKKAEQALNKSFELVNEQNQRLVNFSHIVSHNLRSHASNIEGISVLIETAPTHEDRDEMIQLLKKVVNSLNDTLYNLNNIVNIQTSIDVVREQVNLHDFITKTLHALNAQILNSKAIIINNVSAEVEVFFNKAYLESVLLNLISNALRYAHAERAPEITLTYLKDNEKQVLIVADNGIGINMAKYGDKIFGLYQTFNGNEDARGFGLFITKNQIEAMGGKIELQSTFGEGSTFSIYFNHKTSF